MTTTDQNCVAQARASVIEVLHIVSLESFNCEVFAGITLVIGTILGAFFAMKG